jgi:hypothetical protein
MPTLHLKKFDMGCVEDTSVCMFIGKRKSGKSFALRDLLYHHRDIPIGTVISPTESANKYFRDFVPDIFIHDKYSPALVEKVIRRQKLIMKRVNKETAVYGSTNIDPRAFFIMDDCMHDRSWIKDENVNYSYSAGRHVKLLTCCTLQYPLGVPPSMRTNIDYVFIFREPLVNNRKRLYDSYAGIFPTFQMFCDVLDSTTENFECLVINNICKSNKIEDIVFWYKAEMRPDFKMCSPESWRAHEENYVNEEDANDEDMYDPTKARKAGPSVTVKKLW